MTPNFVLLYVESPPDSARFYQDLFGAAPVESSPGFALFVLESGMKLGLWARADAQPAPQAAGGGTEIGVPVLDYDMVDQTYTHWSAKGLTMIQPPTDLDFGRSFVALDPDGHRLRVFALAN